jgi:hypothetical protein
MTFKSLLNLWKQNLAEYGVFSAFLVLSKNKLNEILDDSYFTDIQNTNRHIGVSDSWQTIFTLYGLPKVLVIETPNAVEFVSNS